MESKETLEQAIITLTSKIHQQYPELAQFIPEMRDNNSEQEEVNLKNLEEYHNSLLELVTNYVKTQNGE